MVRVRTLAAVAAVAGLLAGSVAYGQGPGNGGRGRGGPGRFGGPSLFGGRGGGALLDLGRLNLTDAQRQQVQQIRERSREAMTALRDRMRQAATAEREAIQALPVDEGRIRAASQALAEVSADVAVQTARIRSEIWSVLTPKQQAEVTKRRTQVQERVRERAERFRERRQNRQERRTQ